MVYTLPYDDERHGRAGAGSSVPCFARSFYQYYRLGSHHEPDGADGEPTDKDGELTEDYEPPHSPFGRIYALISSGAFSYDDVMRRIPWCVVLAMINDQGRLRKKEKETEDIQTEEEEMRFLGLID